jgi:hypothetical protein
MRVCPGCGIIAPFARAECGACKTPFGPAPPIAAGRDRSILFACIHVCEFKCTACGMYSPLASVELGGQVECMRCGLTQAFDVVQWTDALGHAHDVADLSGPSPEGQNPLPGRSIAGKSAHGRIGTEFTSSTKTQNGMVMDARGTRHHTLKTTVSPGHPLCRACRVPLEVVLEGQGVTRTRCPRCNDAATYALPENAASTYAALRGVIAGEQRTDRPVARTTRGQSGALGVACPQCGAALAAGEGEIVKCTYCATVARVPGRLARRQIQGEPPKVDPFWVLLDGLSPGRKKLLRGKSEDDDDDDDDDDMAHAGPMPPSPNGMPAWAHPNMQHGAYGAHQPPRSIAGLVIGISVAVVVLVALLGAGAAFYLQADDDPPARQAPLKKGKR